MGAMATAASRSEAGGSTCAGAGLGIEADVRFAWAASAVDAEAVTVDGNHPLAGVPLHFSIEIAQVRAATAEELAHGHVHGAGGHHH